MRGGIGSSAVYVDAPAPIHLVIGNAGAELTPVASNPEKIWEVRLLRCRRTEFAAVHQKG